MKLHLLRSAKYLLKLLILLGAIYALLFLTGTARVSADALFAELFTTPRGWIMLGALVILAAVYPGFGFVNRTSSANPVKDRDKILKAFAADGYALTSEKDGRMTFRASSPVKRLAGMFDDRVTVTPREGGIAIEGIRKEVVRAQFRINTYLQNETEQND